MGSFALFDKALPESFRLLVPVVDPGFEPLDRRLELGPLGDLVRDLGPGASQVAVLSGQPSLPLGHPVAFGSQLSTETFRLGVVSRQTLSGRRAFARLRKPRRGDDRAAVGPIRALPRPDSELRGPRAGLERERNLPRDGSGRHCNPEYPDGTEVSVHTPGDILCGLIWPGRWDALSGRAGLAADGCPEPAARAAHVRPADRWEQSEALGWGALVERSGSPLTRPWPLVGAGVRRPGALQVTVRRSGADPARHQWVGGVGSTSEDVSVRTR